MTHPATDRRVFDLRSGTRIAVLRAAAMVDVAVGISFSVAAVGLWFAVIAAGTGPGSPSDLLAWAVLATIVGLVVTWSGLVMMFNRVVVTQRHLTSGQALRIRRRVERDSIITIDIRQKNFGRAPRSVVVASLREGPDLYLMPIETLIARRGENSQLAAQRSVVTELRWALKVHGSDLDPAHVRWPDGT